MKLVCCISGKGGLTKGRVYHGTILRDDGYFIEAVVFNDDGDWTTYPVSFFVPPEVTP